MKTKKMAQSSQKVQLPKKYRKWDWGEGGVAEMKGPSVEGLEIGEKVYFWAG